MADDHLVRDPFQRSRAPGRDRLERVLQAAPVEHRISSADEAPTEAERVDATLRSPEAEN